MLLIYFSRFRGPSNQIQYPSKLDPEAHQSFPVTFLHHKACGFRDLGWCRATVVLEAVETFSHFNHDVLAVVPHGGVVLGRRAPVGEGQNGGMDAGNVHALPRYAPASTTTLSRRAAAVEATAMAPPCASGYDD